MGEKKHHACGKFNIVLREKRAARNEEYIDFLGQIVDAYWIPLAGEEDLYIHFANDITEWANESLFPQKCEDKAGCGTCNCM